MKGIGLRLLCLLAAIAAAYLLYDTQCFAADNATANAPGAPVPRRHAVLSVHQSGIIEILGGSDGGIKPGDRGDVIRTLKEGPVYVGRLEVIRTNKERSVAQMLGRRAGSQPGDEVTFSRRSCSPSTPTGPPIPAPAPVR